MSATASTKRTALYETHKRLGAKIIPFAGFEMPVNYPKGIIAEHNAVRRAVGMFDVSHMGEVEVRGRDALAFVQRIGVNDASVLVAGRAQYSAMCYADGGIVDDLLVYRLGGADGETVAEAWFMLVINASNIEKDLAWMREQAQGLDVELLDVSEETNLLAVQGPHSLKTLQKLTTAALEDIAYYHFVEGTLAGVPMILSRTGYTGELGFELYFKGAAHAEAVWNAVMDAGAEFGIEPVGLGARDTLRLEKGFCLYGNDISQTTNPLEAGLGWITKFKRADDSTFAGKDALLRIKETRAAEGNVSTVRKLVALKLQHEKVIPRAHYTLHTSDGSGRQIGEVTSGTISPTLGVGIALGYVEAAYSAVGSIVHVSVRGKESPAEVVKPPFV
jgi:aminomethyltransferase